MSSYEYQVCTHCDTAEVVVEWREGENFREARRDKVTFTAAVLAVTGVAVGAAGAAALALGYATPPHLRYWGAIAAAFIGFAMCAQSCSLMGDRKRVGEWNFLRDAPVREAARAVLDVEPARVGGWSCRVVPDEHAAGITRAWYAKKQQGAEERRAREQDKLQRCAEEEGSAHAEGDLPQPH